MIIQIFHRFLRVLLPGAGNVLYCIPQVVRELLIFNIINHLYGARCVMARVIYRVILCLFQSAFSSPVPVRDSRRTGCNTFSSHPCIPAPGIPSRRWDRRALPSSSSQVSDAYVSTQTGKCLSRTSSVCLLDSAIFLFRIPGRSPWLRHREIPHARCPLIQLPQSQLRLSLHPRICPLSCQSHIAPYSYSAEYGLFFIKNAQKHPKSGELQFIGFPLSFLVSMRITTLASPAASQQVFQFENRMKKTQKWLKICIF